MQLSAAAAIGARCGPVRHVESSPHVEASIGPSSDTNDESLNEAIALLTVGISQHAAT